MKRNYSIEAFLAMIAFGLVIGIIFPVVVNPFVEWIPGMKKYFVILCLVAGLLVGANSFALAWALLLRRFKSMAESINESAIAEGDLTYRIPVRSSDIIGLVARRFNENTEHMQQVVSAIFMSRAAMEKTLKSLDSRISEMEIIVSSYESQILDVQSEVNEMNSSMDTIVSQVSTLSEGSQETSSAILEQQKNISQIEEQTDEVAGYVVEITSSLEELEASIRQVSDNATTMSASAESTRALVKNMSSLVNQIQDIVKETDEYSSGMVDEAREGKKKVGDLSSSMVEINDKNTELGTVFGKLKEGSDSIGKIISTMGEIGDQTGLLALNAAIIAAQAKDEGRSFAVVASEIRALSDRTSGSAREISNILKDIQTGITMAHTVILENDQNLSNGLSVSTDADQALNSILTKVDQARTRVSSIGKLMEEQGIHFRDISGAMENVSQITRSVADAVKEQETGAELIGKTSSHINELTSTVKRALEEQSKVARQISSTTSNFDSMATGVDALSKTQAEKMNRINSLVAEIRRLFEEEKKVIGSLSEDRNKTMNSLADLSSEIDRFSV